jgi:hypothetical protein
MKDLFRAENSHWRVCSWVEVGSRFLGYHHKSKGLAWAAPQNRRTKLILQGRHYGEYDCDEVNLRPAQMEWTLVDAVRIVKRGCQWQRALNHSLMLYGTRRSPLSSMLQSQIHVSQVRTSMQSQGPRLRKALPNTSQGASRDLVYKSTLRQRRTIGGEYWKVWVPQCCVSYRQQRTG